MNFTKTEVLTVESLTSKTIEQAKEAIKNIEKYPVPIRKGYAKILNHLKMLVGDYKPVVEDVFDALKTVTYKVVEVESNNQPTTNNEQENFLLDLSTIPNNGTFISREIPVSEVKFTAQTLEGDQIDMEFTQIGFRTKNDDIFFFCGELGSIPCVLSSLRIVLPL